MGTPDASGTKGTRRIFGISIADLKLTVFVNAAKYARLPVEHLIASASLVPDEPFLDPAAFPWIKDFERAFAEIRNELDALDTSVLPSLEQLSVRQSKLQAGPGWKTYFFKAYGVRADANCQACPTTARVIDSVEEITTAFFSVLEPGTRLAEHRGPWKGLLRYHLAVKVPKPTASCGIRVADQTRHWVEGSSLLFDDTFPHAAWNDSDSTRVVLFVDVKRPLRFPLSRINDAVIGLIGASPYVRHALDRFERMQENLNNKEHKQ